MCLKTDDGSLIHVNRSTLCQWSPVFKVMLMTGNFKKKDQYVVEIREKNTEDLTKFIRSFIRSQLLLLIGLLVWVSFSRVCVCLVCEYACVCVSTCVCVCVRACVCVLCMCVSAYAPVHAYVCNE